MLEVRRWKFDVGSSTLDVRRWKLPGSSKQESNSIGAHWKRPTFNAELRTSNVPQMHWLEVGRSTLEVIGQSKQDSNSMGAPLETSDAPRSASTEMQDAC